MTDVNLYLLSSVQFLKISCVFSKQIIIDHETVELDAFGYTYSASKIKSEILFIIRLWKKAERDSCNKFVCSNNMLAMRVLPNDI